MRIRTFYIKDFGCKINQYDSRLLLKALSGMGYKSSHVKEAGLIIVNACSVTHRAEKDTRKYVRRIRRKYPEKEIVVVGCGARDKNISFNDPRVSGIGQFKYIDNSKMKLERFASHTRAFVKVQQGCYGECTYCNIRTLKKPFFIKKPEAVIEEIKGITRYHKEIVLCATNFSEYTFLKEVVGLISAMNGDFRWRLSSISVNALKEDVIDALSGDKKFCRHFHLPVQSASGNVLKNMKRPYKISDVENCIRMIKNYMPDSVFSFDIITGFPGETEEDFKQTVRFIKNTVPVKVHVFRYSERPGTAAVSYGNKVPERVKKKRLKALKAAESEARRIHLEKALGTTAEIVIENSKYGYTRGYLPVKLESTGVSPSLKKVLIKSHNQEVLAGEILH